MKSPCRTRNALTGKNVNTRSGTIKNLTSLSPKKLVSGTTRRDSPVRGSGPNRAKQGFQFFEQSEIDQKAVENSQRQQQDPIRDKEWNKENVYVGCVDSKATKPGSYKSSPGTLPLSELPAEEYQGIFKYWTQDDEILARDKTADFQPDHGSPVSSSHNLCNDTSVPSMQKTDMSSDINDVQQTKPAEQTSPCRTAGNKTLSYKT